jgi:hypothetical protein
MFGSKYCTLLNSTFFYFFFCKKNLKKDIFNQITENGRNPTSYIFLYDFDELYGNNADNFFAADNENSEVKNKEISENLNNFNISENLNNYEILEYYYGISEIENDEISENGNDEEIINCN